jgi:hypothetical protein
MPAKYAKQRQNLAFFNFSRPFVCFAGNPRTPNLLKNARETRQTTPKAFPFSIFRVLSCVSRATPEPPNLLKNAREIRQTTPKAFPFSIFPSFRVFRGQPQNPELTQERPRNAPNNAKSFSFFNFSRPFVCFACFAGNPELRTPTSDRRYRINGHVNSARIGRMRWRPGWHLESVELKEPRIEFTDHHPPQPIGRMVHPTGH